MDPLADRTVFLFDLCSSRKQKGLRTVHIYRHDATLLGSAQNHHQAQPSCDPAAWSGGKKRRCSRILQDFHATPSTVYEGDQMIDCYFVKNKEDRSGRSGREVIDLDPETFHVPVGSGIIVRSEEADRILCD
jgi:hypothetical protein